MSSHRIEKVSALLKREISKLINYDFAEEFGLITVSDIKVTADFKEAVVYLSIFEQNKEMDILDNISKKSFEYQHQLGRKLKMKFTPKLSFKIDHFQEEIDKVDKLLKEIDHGS